MPHKSFFHQVLVALQTATLLCLPVVVRAQEGFPRGVAPGPAAAPPADFEPGAFAAEGRPLGVRISSHGVLAGRFSVADAITGKKVPALQLVVRVLKDGKVISRAKPGVGGVFQIKGLKAGVHSIVADGSDGYFSSKIRVLPPVAGTPAASDQALQIDATVVHPINTKLAKTIIRDRFLPVDPALTRSMSATYRGEPRDAVSDPVETPMLHLAKDGGLKVRMVGLTPGRSNQARDVISDGFLLQGGKVAARATSDSAGVMEFAPIPPGAYSLVVLNNVDKGAAASTNWANQPRAGFVAMGVQVVGLPPAPRGVGPMPTPASAAVTLEDEIQFVQADGSDVNEIEGIDSAEGEAVVIDSTEPPPEVIPPGGGGFVGGGGGGFGGGGGGGGAGLGLGLAALAAGIGAAAAIAADDNNNGFPIPPASPALPAPAVTP